MNLLIIDDVGLDIAKDIANEIWENGLKHYTCVELRGFSEEAFEKLAENNAKYIAVVGIDFLEYLNPNDVYILLDSYNYVPVILTDDPSAYSLSSAIYYTLIDEIQDTMLYVHNDENIQYDEFIKEASAILLKGSEDE